MKISCVACQLRQTVIIDPERETIAGDYSPFSQQTQMIIKFTSTDNVEFAQFDCVNVLSVCRT